MISGPNTNTNITKNSNTNTNYKSHLPAILGPNIRIPSFTATITAGNLNRIKNSTLTTFSETISYSRI